MPAQAGGLLAKKHVRATTRVPVRHACQPRDRAQKRRCVQLHTERRTQTVPESMFMFALGRIRDGVGFEPGASAELRQRSLREPHSRLRHAHLSRRAAMIVTGEGLASSFVGREHIFCCPAQSSCLSMKWKGICLRGANVGLRKLDLGWGTLLFLWEVPFCLQPVRQREARRTRSWQEKLT